MASCLSDGGNTTVVDMSAAEQKKSELMAAKNTFIAADEAASSDANVNVSTTQQIQKDNPSSASDAMTRTQLPMNENAVIGTPSGDINIPAEKKMETKKNGSSSSQASIPRKKAGKTPRKEFNHLRRSSSGASMSSSALSSSEPAPPPPQPAPRSSEQQSGEEGGVRVESSLDEKKAGESTSSSLAAAVALEELGSSRINGSKEKSKEAPASSKVKKKPLNKDAENKNTENNGPPGSPKKGKKASKTLANLGKVRQSYENEINKVATPDTRGSPTGKKASTPTGKKASTPTGKNASTPTGKKASINKVATPDTRGSPTGKKASTPTGKKASKTLASLGKVRESLENMVKKETRSAGAKEKKRELVESEPQPPLPEVEPSKIQFLAKQTGETKDFNKRVTMDGTILDRIAAVPKTGPSLKKEKSAKSSKLIRNGVMPTMAPPMFKDRPSSSDVDKMMEESLLEMEKSSKKKKKKKGKKRGRDSVSSLEAIDSAAATEGTEKKRGKKRDRDENGDASSHKRKKARGKKSGKKGGKSDLYSGKGPSTANKNATTNAKGVKPPTSPSMASSSSSKAPYSSPFKSPRCRTLAFAPPAPKLYNISTDESPNRIPNPLLRLPQFPNSANYASNDGIIPIEDIPQAGELWNLANLHYATPDTYPISYLARVLGFDVPEDGLGKEFGGSFDPSEVGRMEDRSDAAEETVEVGDFVPRIWTGDASMATVQNNLQSNGLADDLNLSYCDPLWSTILASFRGYVNNEDDFPACTGKNMGFEDTLSEVCLEFARERGVLAKEKKEKKASTEEKHMEKEEKLKEEGKKDEREEEDSEGEKQKENCSGQGVSTSERVEEEGVDLYFRFGSLHDEEVLRSLADKCQWKSHPKHDLATSLRSPSHFCIVAEKKAKTVTTSSPSSSAHDQSGSSSASIVVAFLQYRFCWYRVEEKKRAGNVSTEKISELVTFIDNLVYHNDATVDALKPAVVGDSEIDGKGIGASECSDGVKLANKSPRAVIPQVLPKELETAKVLLTSLALVHAARAGIWYGMMDSPMVQVPFFAKYFRMSHTQHNKELQHSKEDSVPLVLDIKKCHFKYAILLLEESMRSMKNEPTPGQSAVVGTKRKHYESGDILEERLIGNFTTTASKTEQTMSKSRSLRTPARGGSGMVVFSNSIRKEEQKAKRAHVRLVRKSDAEPRNAELFSVLTPSLEEGDTAADEQVVEKALNPIDPSTIDTAVDWNIMKLFPLHSEDNTPLQKDEEPNKDSSCSPNNGISNNIFFSDLRKKQTQLSLLESSIETTSRTILSMAYDEHTAYANGNHGAKSKREKQKLVEYEAVQNRIREAELAWQAQLDQDMDAVCDVCFDGEVTPDNQIIFCDACNVAVHQRCYGIDQIPSGNYFCHTCTHFEIDKEFLAAKRRRDGPPLKITRHPIVCELCPRRQGAFVQVQTAQPTKKAKWVHVSCAKWHGMNYVDIELKDKIEDLTELKTFFKNQSIPCQLCKSSVGALHKCRVEGCDEYLHLTCARSYGKCSVQHGENCEGFYDPETIDYPPWSLACLKHSEEVDPESIKEGSLTAEQLVAIAESYPPEPLPIKPFNKLTGAERKEYWSDPENLVEFFEKVMSDIEGAKCAVCEGPADPSVDKRCDKCGVLSHADCCDPARGERSTCLTCRFVEENANSLRHFEEPRCHMCSHPTASGGPLLRTFAKPTSMKVWKGSGSTLRFQKSIFGKDKFCHAICGMWNPHCDTEGSGEGNDTIINCSKIVMANGKDHVSHQHRCSLCGLHSGAKVDCCVEGCIAPGGSRQRAKFHVTCARQAGLEVTADGDMIVKCWQHSECEFVFRARLEDLREIELNRFLGKTFKSTNPMPWSHAASLFHAAVSIMRTLGWAWRWAEWWVECGDNWEPLIEPGQVEAEMTEEELKIVHSTPQSRCKDARQCRLAAFGAALRNRDYDKEEGDDKDPLERALTAILSTKSLVGPLKKREIEFFVTWLALAYRSKSPLLGFGEDKTPVATDCFCIHQEDSSPKYELGGRPLPGKSRPQNEKGVFEPKVEEVDDFLKSPISASPVRRKKKKKISQEKDIIAVDSDELPEGFIADEKKKKKKKKKKKREKNEE
eukprot:CAMPEP_0183744812 /NCGR_PEP_ID=MMETSP0737-20130205/65920_1 /TAXON_ID=385413 /ORGANISM="Thalassiosira miniscula, Strain CCMP1093" /LENGTH=2099 /DNA_ID=CAMNT_0025980465 /DNA_START=245 /DNA_END=6544 /DNA_ORIENTATION=-